MKPYYDDGSVKIYHGDCRTILPELTSQIDCIITSPPYWGLRDYGHGSQIGLEQTPEAYVEQMVSVFGLAGKILSADGTLWLNLGDSYAGNCSRTSSGRAGMGAEREGVYVKTGEGIKPKDLVGIPWRTAFALQAQGWYLRQDIIWHKPNPMPESVTDRCTKAHEYIFLLAKNQKYYFDAEVIKEQSIDDNWNSRLDRAEEGQKRYPNEKVAGIRRRKFGANNQKGTMRHDTDRYFEDNGYRNKRSVWTVTTKPFAEAHFATFPEELIYPCVLAGCPKGGMILDPFMGAGTTLKVAKYHKRQAIGIELNEEYIKIAIKRLRQEVLI